MFNLYILHLSLRLAELLCFSYNLCQVIMSLICALSNMDWIVLFQPSLTSGNYDSLIRHLSNEITTRLEKNVMKTTFNRVSMCQMGVIYIPQSDNVHVVG